MRIGGLTSYLEVGIDDGQYIKAVDPGNNVDWEITDDGDASFRNIRSGVVTLTPSAADTPTLIVISWDDMGETPEVVATPYTSVPGCTVTGVGVMERSRFGCTIYLTRKDTTETNVGYFAHVNI